MERDQERGGKERMKRSTVREELRGRRETAQSESCVSTSEERLLRGRDKGELEVVACSTKKWVNVRFRSMICYPSNLVLVNLCLNENVWKSPENAGTAVNPRAIALE